MNTTTRRKILAGAAALPLLPAFATPADPAVEAIGHGARPMAPMSGPLIALMSRMTTRS